MKALLSLFIFFQLSTLCYAQQISMEIGRVNSTFRYSNSDGENTLQLYSQSKFSYSLGFKKPLNSRFLYGASLIFDQYHNIGTDQYNIHSFAWDADYLGLMFGVDSEFFRHKKFSFFGSVALGPQFLAGGKQIINNKVIPLKGVEQFKTPRFFLRPAIGFNYCSARDVAIFFKYNYGRSIKLSKNFNEESLDFSASTISIGILWSLKTCEYCHKRRY